MHLLSKYLNSLIGPNFRFRTYIIIGVLKWVWIWRNDEITRTYLLTLNVFIFLIPFEVILHSNFARESHSTILVNKFFWTHFSTRISSSKWHKNFQIFKIQYVPKYKDFVLQTVLSHCFYTTLIGVSNTWRNLLKNH